MIHDVVADLAGIGGIAVPTELEPVKRTVDALKGPETLNPKPQSLNPKP